MLVCGAITITLAWFAVAGDSLARNHALLTVLLVLPIAGWLRWWVLTAVACEF